MMTPHSACLITRRTRVDMNQIHVLTSIITPIAVLITTVNEWRFVTRKAIHVLVVGRCLIINQRLSLHSATLRSTGKSR